jgi:molecular chaperone DnaK (HSP70)
MEYFISIDFGTCNSVISFLEDNNILQIENINNGDVLIPTTIYFLSNELNDNLKIGDLKPNIHYLIGNEANDNVSINKDTEYYFCQFKRFLGITKKSIDSFKEFLEIYNLDYSVDDELIYFNIKILDSDKKLKISITDLVSLYFKALYELISNKLNMNEKINCVLTCPAYFHDLQRSQLKNSAENANFSIYKIFNEPTAASIYYIDKINNNSDKNKIIIYDLGGGTIDTTVMEYYKDENICEVIDIDGNNHLGGIDIDNILFYDIFNKYNIDKTNYKWKQKIKKIAEEIKIKLTYTDKIDIYLENVPIKINNSINILESLKVNYSRRIFNNLINQLIEEMINPIKLMYKKHNTNNIIFIGGPTQIPLLQSKVNSILNNNTYISSNNLYKTIVSKGATLLFKKIFNKEDFCLLDILPMNIGISDNNDNMIIMINKNSKIPISIEKTFTTTYDCQRTIDIDVYEGNENKCNENTFIGSYKLIGIPPLIRGSILIKLLFKISYNGILNVSIEGFENSNNEIKSNYNCNKDIKLIPSVIAKNILKKILLSTKK